MERIDFEKYDLHGDELLIAAAVAGLYAMEVDENGGMEFTGKGEFTVDGENLTMEFLGETVTLVRVLD